MILIHGKRYYIRAKKTTFNFIVDSWYTNRLLATHLGIEISVLSAVIERKIFVSQKLADKFCDRLDCDFDDIFELVNEEVIE